MNRSDCLMRFGISTLICFGIMTSALCAQSGTRNDWPPAQHYGHSPAVTSAGCASCSDCQSGGCEHCPDNCPQSKKPIIDKVKGLVSPCKDCRVTGFCVDEVRYGANAGYPSFGMISHGPWYNGPVKHLNPMMSAAEKLRLRTSIQQNVQYHYCQRCRSKKCHCAPTGYYHQGHYAQRQTIKPPSAPNPPSRTASNPRPLAYPLDQQIEKR